MKRILFFTTTLFFCPALLLAGAATLRFSASDIVREARENAKENINIKTSAKEKALSVLKSMTLDEKIGQMIMIGVNGLDDKPTLSWSDSAAAITENQIANLAKYKPGGVIIFKSNVKNTEQITAYINALQRHSDIPLFISVDEEGGSVSRLGVLKNVDVTLLSAPVIQGKLPPEQFAKLRANLCTELKQIGVNDNHDTMCDLPTNEKNQIIKGRGRYYSTDIGKTCELIKTNVRVTKENGIVTSAKHFPGHGDTVIDSHDEMPVCEMTLEELNGRELLPFRVAVEAGVPRIMVSHIAYPQITGSATLPATLSKDMINIIRRDLGFNGIIITDDMHMDAIGKYFTAGQSAAMAAAAGNDMVIYRIHLAEVFEGIKSGVGKSISEQQINESVLRILETKIAYGIIK